MWTLILPVVTLLLVTGFSKPADNLPYKYGDIIAFPKTLFNTTFTYKHYAIYVDKKRFPEQEEGENIFHFTGSFKTRYFSTCKFGQIKTNKKHEKDNYLDKIESFKNKVFEEEITTRIKEKYKSCHNRRDTWEAFSNNCEHLANYIRYGEKISLQLGQTARHLVYNPQINRDQLKFIKEQLNIPEKEPCEATCQAEVEESKAMLEKATEDEEII